MAEDPTAAAPPAPTPGAAPPAPIKEINLVGEEVDDRPAISEIIEEPYNADRSRDATRQTITLWLIGLLCAIVSLTFVALFARGSATGFTHPSFFSELKQVLDVIVGPVITLLASAIGFYFGYKQGELTEQAKSARGSP